MFSGKNPNPSLFRDEATLCEDLHKKISVSLGEEPSNATKLHYAALNGDLFIVKSLIRKGADVNARDGDGGTPLHLAAIMQRSKVVRTLIKAGADVNDDLGERGSILVCAAETKSLEIVKILVENGADVHVTNPTQNNINLPLIHSAAMHSTPDIVNFLLDHGVDVNETCSVKGTVGFSPLHAAAERGNTEIVKVLIDRGGDVNSRDSKDRSPLHFSAFKGHLEVSRLLVKELADVNAETDKKWTALHFAMAQDSYALAKVLLEKGANINARENDLKLTPIQISASLGHNLLTYNLLNRGANVKLQDFKNKTLLHFAIESLLPDVIDLIILNGADVNAKTVEGVTPAYTAVLLNRPDVLKLLLRQGAFFNASAEKKCLPLIDLAKKCCFTEVIEILALAERLFSSVISNDCHRVKHCLRSGAIVNVKNSDGRTPLHYAITKGNIKTTKILLSNQADITIVTNKGNTLLHLAVSHDNAEVLEVLLKCAKKLSVEECKTFINAKTFGKGMTALHVASLKNNFSMVKLLLEHGAMYCPKNVDLEIPSQLTTNKSIQNLFSVLDELFQDAKKGNPELTEKVKNLASGTFSVAKSALNDEMQNLIETLQVNKHE